MKVIKTIIPLIASVLATSCGASKNVYPTGEWTILMYMCGSNLESDYANQTIISDGYYTYRWNGMGLATLDISEVLHTKNKPNNVNVVIMTGGSSKWTKSKYGKYGSYDIDAKKLQIHHVNKDNELVLDKTLDYSSMGKSSTLQTFMEYGLKRYPAKKTALVLWNHGGGLQGVCFDEKTNDGLTATEVTNAVGNALHTCGKDGEKLEWIGYDACLMAVQDIAELNSQYFNYMVASQQLESGTGWVYNEWLDDVYANEETPVILQSICDSFIKDNDYPGYANDQTLAYFDLSCAFEYKEAWEDMAVALGNKLSFSNQDDFNDLIDDCHCFGDDAAVAYGLVDVKDFIDKLDTSEFKVSEEIMNALRDSFDNFVAYSAKGNEAGNANGLSMYWTIDRYTSWYNSYTEDDTNFLNWMSLVDQFGE